MVDTKNYFYGKKFVGKENAFFGKKHTDEVKAKVSKANKGNTYCLGRVLSEETKEKIRQAQLKNGRKGKDSNLYKHGNYPQHLLERRSSKYKLWRVAVFTRDNYSCVGCGANNCYLNAHHIKPFATYPLLRYELSNGVTYCKDCHSKAHKGMVIPRRKNAIKK